MTDQYGPQKITMLQSEFDEMEFLHKRKGVMFDTLFVAVHEFVLIRNPDCNEWAIANRNIADAYRKVVDMVGIAEKEPDSAVRMPPHPLHYVTAMTSAVTACGSEVTVTSRETTSPNHVTCKDCLDLRVSPLVFPDHTESFTSSLPGNIETIYERLKKVEDRAGRMAVALTVIALALIWAGLIFIANT